MLTANQPLGIDQCTCTAIRRASRRITRFYDDYLEPTGLRITQFMILSALSEAGSAAINTLAERLDIERTAMGKMVGFLERDGVVEVKQSPEDGRFRIVDITDEGRRLHRSAEPLWQKAQLELGQLNGVENVAKLRQDLNEVEVQEAVMLSNPQ